MTYKKASIKVKYIVEKKDLDVGWEYFNDFKLLEEAIDYLERIKKAHPKDKFRLLRSEWEVVG